MRRPGRPRERTEGRMAKKTAAKYSELSKTKKKRRPDTAPEPPQAAVAATKEAPKAQPRPVPRTSPRSAQRTQTESRRGVPGYAYMRADLKRIGMLAGGMILILIVLAFVLG